MCRPASMVVTKKKVYWSENSDSHENIIKEYNLREMDIRCRATFVRVEIVPPENDYRVPLSRWVFSTDQDLIPEWYDSSDAERRCRAELKKWRKANVVLEKEKVSTEGYVAAAYGTVEAYGNATVEAYGNATVKAYDNATVKAYGNATVTACNSATVEAYGNATVKACNSATVKACNSATVKAYDSATVIGYTPLDVLATLLSKKAVLIDRSKDTVVCQVGN
jgi:hypothetical protein